jgi:tetratricopeptide (TPR) repeat protein
MKQQPRQKKPANPSQLFQQGVLLHRQGKFDQANEFYKAVLAVQPKHFDALYLLGVLHHQRGQNTEALGYLSGAQKMQPTNVAVLSTVGLVQASLGRPREALSSFDRALTIKPDNAEALNNRGLTLANLGRHGEALESFDRALAFKPDFTDALTNRGNLLARLGRAAEALASYDRALACKPDLADAFNNRGNVLRDLKRPTDALVSYDKALTLNPNYAEAFNNRGNALADLNRTEEALASFDKALALNPNYADALNNRGNALRDLKRPADALASFDRALALKPNDPFALNNRGNALRDLKRSAEALTNYDKALSFKPDYAEAYSNKGVALTEFGRFAEASEAIERAIALVPRSPNFYYNLAEAKRLAADDPYVRIMEELTQETHAFSPGEQIALHFGLGKVFADNRDHERSFQHFLRGNALKRQQTVYDEAAHLGYFERARAAFTRELMHGREGCGDPSSLPVFILGMPRSGSTLVEQILASHPKVFGAGEIDDFSKTMTAVGGASISETILQMSDENLRRLGSIYIDSIRAVAPAAARITNKTPENFRFIGLIHLALPNARIIHTRRDPVDTCLSCFSKLFVDNLPYTYDLGELGRYYRAYETMMAHWHDALPQGAVLDVQYEDVVADLEGQARRIIAHCGLEWDARCLDFHQTERPVRTASKAQVRQPLYRSSVGRWRVHEPFLGPLLTELEPLLAAGGPDDAADLAPHGPFEVAAKS